MRSHTGGVISFGKGGLLCKSTKQKINTKSSTEAELIGVSDYLPQALYVQLFMAAQGYPIHETTLLQDNESAIKLESNGKLSSGQRTRHIDIRHFFITDHVKRHNITNRHCHRLMLADFFTKPLQGALFRKFRAVLLGHDHISTLLPFLSQFFATSSPPSTAEERVGNENTMLSTSEVRATSGNQHMPGSEISTARHANKHGANEIRGANEILSSPGSSAATRLDAEQRRASSHSLAKYPEI